MARLDESEAIRGFLQDYGGEGGYDAGGGSDRAFDQQDKADNAVDYEDISDEDDLPEEETATNNIDEDADVNGFFAEVPGGVGGLPVQKAKAPSLANGYQDEDQDVKKQISGDLFGDVDEVNDLFGEQLSSPEQERVHPSHHIQSPMQRPGGLALPSKSSLALPGTTGGYQAIAPHYQHQSSAALSPSSSFRGEGYSPATSYEGEESEEEILDEKEREQRRLFKLAARKHAGEQVNEATEEIDMDVFYRLFPRFEANQYPNFIDLFPSRAVAYRRKIPLKPPRPVFPTKLSLDLLPDQEKAFRAPAAANKAKEDNGFREGLICFDQGTRLDDSDDELALSAIDENERVGGVTMQDLAILCEDWETPALETDSSSSPLQDTVVGDWDADETKRPAKKRKRDILDMEYSMSVQDPQLPFEHPERATAKLARSVALDLNDPNLLIDEIPPASRRKAKPVDIRRDVTASKDVAKRYNISNDEAYDQLKENHQHKVRSTLSGMTVEHSMPAARLQYPFYKMSLDNKVRRSFHRPHLDLRESRGREIRFSKPKHIKRKHLKGRETKDILAKAEDLQFGDNSSVLLLEYSEEAPIMLSNFGMGNRLINYYRKRNTDDNERPKRDIGETQVLLTQDKSPFANFGHVDRGEIVPTIQNGLYRAPIYQHKPKPTDFLVGLSSTYQSGHRFYLRNVENLHTVGQQFPFVDVPGEHSRRVTDAAKKRLRALAYRIWTKSKDPSRPRVKPLTNENLMPHLPGHDMPQTRSKMREFMSYKRAPGKDSGGTWEPPPGSVVPDAEVLRSWIKPEDICLLDSMQVGVQHLKDLGITNLKEPVDDDKDVEDGANIEVKLAPWRITKNFLAATQGKAMLGLHGEGDPTGRGEAFSFLKISMKGGFQALGESASDKIEAKKRRETGGHSYNVAQQQNAYDESIRRIWDKQKSSLSAEQEFSDTDMEDEADDMPSNVGVGRGATPRSAYGTPAAFARHDDESASQFSKSKADKGETVAGRVINITRKSLDKYGQPVTTYERVTNPRVVAAYRKRYMEKQLSNFSLYDMNPTDDPELNQLKQQKLQQELMRIERNADRRVAREKAKGKYNAGSPNAVGSPAGGEVPDGTVSATDGTPQKGRGRNKDGTARKCANCGQVGHIKTNRKSVPTFHCIFCGSPDYNPEPVVTSSDGGGRFSAVSAELEAASSISESLQNGPERKRKEK